MGFLDNSGDIILDAVLTDTGRFRLAKETVPLKLPNTLLAMTKLTIKFTTKTTQAVQHISI